MKKRLIERLRQATSKVDPAVSETDPAQLPFPQLNKASEVYKMFQGTSSDMPAPREVLSVEYEDETTSNETKETDVEGALSLSTIDTATQKIQIPF